MQRHISLISPENGVWLKIPNLETVEDDWEAALAILAEAWGVDEIVEVTFDKSDGTVHAYLCTYRTHDDIYLDGGFCVM